MSRNPHLKAPSSAPALVRKLPPTGNSPAIFPTRVAPPPRLLSSYLHVPLDVSRTLTNAFKHVHC
ncbi:hypothetical protein PM082_000119 [Marasmius tenuissimus]|nr:hypothetical protein PM082_000119 [Marasmius tenuissimus]